MVAPSVGLMSYERLAYDDQDPTARMHQDCAAAGTRIALPQTSRRRLDLTRPAPSLGYDEFPREIRKPRIEVSEAAAHLAARLHLHLD